ncbi:MAG: 50S ribosomal protein L4 [Candidatus Woesearchaeota archaeon]
MKADVYGVDGKKIKAVQLPKQFDEPVREDLIKRAVLVVQASKRQRYGAKKGAGMRQSATMSRRRRKYRGSYGRGISRVPRKVLTKRGTQFYFIGAVAPGTVGGRKAHPPKAEKIWEKKINIKERRKGIRSALNATTNLEIVKLRGHKVEFLPLVVESKFEKLESTKEVKKVLVSLGLDKELERVGKKKIRAGKGKSRGRKYKTKKGPLIVTSKECELSKSARNISGLDVCKVNNLNAELLAPGAVPGRLTIYTEDSLKVFDDKSLFLESKGVIKK